MQLNVDHAGLRYLLLEGVLGLTIKRRCCLFSMSVLIYSALMTCNEKNEKLMNVTQFIYHS